MAEPKFDRDEWDRLWRTVEGLQDRIRLLENNARPTVPVYDPAQFPINPVEGQVALGTDEKAYKYQNGAWSEIGGGTGLSFDTYPQDGGYLYVETDDAIDSTAAAAIAAEFPNLYIRGLDRPGMLLIDKSGNGLNLYTPFGPLSLFADGDNLNLLSTYEVHVDGGSVFISGGAAGGVIIQAADGGGMILNSDGAGLLVESSDYAFLNFHNFNFTGTSYDGLELRIHDTGLFAIRSTATGTYGILAVHGDGKFRLIDPSSNNDVLRITPGSPYTYEMKIGSSWAATL